MSRSLAFTLPPIRSSGRSSGMTNSYRPGKKADVEQIRLCTSKISQDHHSFICYTVFDFFLQFRAPGNFFVSRKDDFCSSFLSSSFWLQSAPRKVAVTHFWRIWADCRWCPLAWRWPWSSRTSRPCDLPCPWPGWQPGTPPASPDPSRWGRPLW